jgi:hypothetical protein
MVLWFALNFVRHVLRPMEVLHMEPVNVVIPLPLSRRGKVTGSPCLHTERGIDTHCTNSWGGEWGREGE